MKRYVRLTYRGGDMRRARTIWAEVVRRGRRSNTYREVDEQGEDRSYAQADGTIVDVQRLIEHAAIVRELPARMNTHYGLLEPAEGDV